MAQNPPYKICFAPKRREEEEEDEKIYKRCKEIVATLPTTKGWSGQQIYQYKGFGYDPVINGVGPLVVQEYFKARPSDILLSSIPKCGITWLKSLAFAVMNSKSYPPSAQKQQQQHPLHMFNSHDLVPGMEWMLYNNHSHGNRTPNLDILPSPRLFGTHMPYTSPLQSVTNSGSPIVYICRNTKDNLISWWHFINKIRPNNSLEPIKLEEAFEMFCQGKSSVGPFWEHVLGYWKASLERPQNVLFLKYGDMVAEPTLHLKRIAEFIGCSFSLMEEKEGVIDQIIMLCSFENLSNLEVNKTGKCVIGIPNNAFFGQGKDGDSANYLTSEMLEQLDWITKQKSHGSGLTL